jgi:ATP-binding cassette subfamily F protein 3
VASPRAEDRLEQEIERAEAALQALEDELADPSAWAGPEASARSAARHEEAKRTVEELYRQLEEVVG